MNAELETISQRLIGAVADGAWQGLVVVALVASALKLFRNVNAATKHAVWFVTLLMVAALPFAILLWPKKVVITPKAAEMMAGPVEAIAFEATGTPEAPPVFTMESISVALVAAWLFLAALRLMFLARQIHVLRRIKHRGQAPETLNAFQRVRAEVRTRRQPRLLFSDKISAPMVVGFFRPAVVLPETLRGEANVADLFRHELAHVARWDDWANLAQQALSAIYFFHPAIHFISRRLTSEREIACDDFAVARTGKPREYALLLTDFASRMKGRDFIAAPAAWSSKSQLKERISMILDAKRNASPRVSRTGAGVLGAAALLVAISALAMAPRFVAAAEEVVEKRSTTEVFVDETPEATVRTTITRSEPGDVSVATITTSGPREKYDALIAAPVGVGLHSAPVVRSLPAPRPVAVAHPHEPHASPPPRPPKPEPRPGRSGEDLERRLERLERMVERLGPADKGEKRSFNLNFDNDFNARRSADFEKAHIEVEKAQREVEKAMRDIDFGKIHKEAWASAQVALEHSGEDRRVAAKMHGQSLKARRQALEAQRKAIDKQIEALEKQMEKDSNRPQADQPEPPQKPEKPEKKRDTGGDDAGIRK